MSHGKERKVHSSKVWRNPGFSSNWPLLMKCVLWPRGSEQPPVLPRPATQCPPSNFRWTLICPMKSLRDILRNLTIWPSHHSSHPHPAWQEQLRLQMCPLPSLSTMIRPQFTVLRTLRRNYEEALCPTSWPRSIHADLPKISTILVPSSFSMHVAGSTCTIENHLEPFKCIEPFCTMSCPRVVPRHHAGKVAVDRAALSPLQVA